MSVSDEPSTQESAKIPSSKSPKTATVESPNPQQDGNVLAGLDTKAVAILQDLRRHPGSSMVKIAQRLNIDRTVVSDRIRDPRFQRALYEITLKPTQLLDRYAPDAVRKLGQLIQHSDPNISGRNSDRVLKHHLGLNINIGPQEPKPPTGVTEHDSKELIKRWLEEKIRAQATDAESS